MLEVQCKTCQKIFFKIPSQVSSSGNSFCSHSCSAKFNNSQRGIDRFCLQCNKKLLVQSNQRKYCNHICQFKFQNIKKIQEWKSGKISGLDTNGVVTPFVKNYLINKRGNKCVKCGWAEINPTTGKVPIEANHIDGNWENNTEENIELICPNCHSLTSTYRSLNKGNGRSQRSSLTKIV